MERLLAYPPTLPLVHVDHSHRVSQVATGVCVSIHNSNPIKAQCLVTVTPRYEAKYTEYQNYLLDELDCNTQQPIASTDTAYKVVNWIGRLAAKHINDQYQSKFTLTGVSFIGDTKEEFDIAEFDRDVRKGKITYKDSDENAVIRKVRIFLSKYYAATDGPMFHLKYSGP